MGDEESLPEASTTVRQRLVRWLERGEHDFEELRGALRLPAKQLEEELRHVERSVRSRGRKLRVTPPRCADCGFAFPGRGTRHLRVPGRCPRCKGERIEPPRFHVS
jgi:predicted Zn-ribbon and HTH transcriptional regulator